jgi:hypothetical protein
MSFAGKMGCGSIDAASTGCRSCHDMERGRVMTRITRRFIETPRAEAGEGLAQFFEQQRSGGQA